MRIGIIGAGFMGRAPARLAVLKRQDVMLSNLHNPAMQPNTMISYKIGTPGDVAAFAEIVMLMVPFSDFASIAPATLAGKIVLDTTSYYPVRDGHIAALDNGSRGSSELVVDHFKGAFIVKGFNAIAEEEMERDARPSGTPNRRAVPIAGDVDTAKQAISGLLDRLGFDVVDAGPLSEGWRFEQGRPAYGVALDSAGLIQALGLERAEQSA